VGLPDRLRSAPLTFEWHDFEDCCATLGDYADQVVDDFEAAQREAEGLWFILKYPHSLQGE
jgi:RNAse (barnase) inhibitor barstar